MLHFRGGRDGISREAYPELEPAFYDDVAAPTATNCDRSPRPAARYVQMDDTNLAYLCDPKMREAARSRGDDPDELPHRYAEFINRVVAQKPAGMMLAMHLCRGNFKSTWAARAATSRWPRRCCREMDIDAYFLEYDDARSGDFRPLRFLPKGKIVVLGLVTTKLGELENKDDLKRRIDEAAKYVPLEQLALSPQCGFASTVHGNDIAVEAQRASCSWWSRRRARSLGLRPDRASACALASAGRRPGPSVVRAERRCWRACAACLLVQVLCRQSAAGRPRPSSMPLKRRIHLHYQEHRAAHRQRAQTNSVDSTVPLLGANSPKLMKVIRQPEQQDHQKRHGECEGLGAGNHQPSSFQHRFGKIKCPGLVRPLGVVAPDAGCEWRRSSLRP